MLNFNSFEILHIKTTNCVCSKYWFFFEVMYQEQNRYSAIVVFLDRQVSVITTTKVVYWGFIDPIDRCLEISATV
jgi:hypothetical protein